MTESWVKYDNLRFKDFSHIILILVGNETDDGDVMNYEWWRQWKLIGMMAASRCLIASAKYDMRCATTGNNGLNLKNWKADRIDCHIQNILFLGTELRIGIYNIAWTYIKNFRQLCENKCSIFKISRTLKRGSEWALYLLQEIILIHLFCNFSIL